MIENQEANLLTNLKSLIKTYLIHDGQGRIIAAYEAKSTAVVGEPCVLTRYSYRGVATTNIRFRQEFNSTWDPDNQGWDDELLSSPMPSPTVDLDPV